MKVTIVGTGTAGLITALILKRKYSENIDIEIIGSKEIGIIGVGEGSTEHWYDFLGWCGIDYFEVIRKCNCTLKSGIMFKGWGKKDYLHSVVNNLPRMGQENIDYLKWISKGKTVNQFTSQYFIKNRIPLNNKLMTYQFHFDTFKLNDFLKEKCLERGIKVIEDTIKEIKLDKNGIDFIKGRKKYKSDFYIDCTGFKKLLIGCFKNRWISFKDYLKVNSAIVFPTKDTNNYNIYTTATAMKAGWMFNIPVWGRHGNGYIYDSNVITKEKAHQEVEKKLNKKIDIRKEIKFEPGHLEKVWIKNCYAVGLSANFVEPLEATSIGTSIQQAYLLAHHLHGYDEKISEFVNKQVESIMNNIRDFIALHYITKNKGQFWKETKVPDSLKYKLEVFKNRLPIQDDFMGESNYRLFSDRNYIIVMHGLGLLNIEKVKKQYNMLRKEIKHNLKDVEEDLSNTVTHKEWIRHYRNEV